VAYAAANAAANASAHAAHAANGTKIKILAYGLTLLEEEGE